MEVERFRGDCEGEEEAGEDGEFDPDRLWDLSSGDE
jgi:hypothetical protein